MSKTFKRFSFEHKGFLVDMKKGFDCWKAFVGGNLYYTAECQNASAAKLQVIKAIDIQIQ